MSQPIKQRRRVAGALVTGLWVTGALAQACLGVVGAAAQTAGPIARLSRTLTVNDTGKLHLLKAFGSVLVEEGAATGTLPGRTNVRMVVGPTVTATFSIGTRNGTIYGRGAATLHSSGRYASFGGWLSVSHGTGRYARAHGTGKLYGVIDRRTDALTVQTIGKLGY